jgi:outer membrane immunogenic protein
MRYLLGVATAISLTGSAMAADLPVYSKAPAPFWSWTGCYAGINVGMGWSKIGLADGAGDDLGTGNGMGAMGGGQVGCDLQLFKALVIGVEGKLDAAKLEGNAVDPAGIITDNTKLPWTGTVTGRLGYAIEPITLLYVRAGAAFTRDRLAEATFNGAGAQVPLTTFNDSRTGWTFGTGIEHKFFPYLTAFVEYNYLDFGTQTITTTANVPSGFAANVKASENAHEVLFGVNLRFNSFAKY